MPVKYPYTQYGGIWKLNAASAAQGAGTWAVPPTLKLFAFGLNAAGQLGLSNTTNYSSPKQVGLKSDWAYLSSGYGFSTGIKIDGTLWTWGANNFGQLGLGNTTYYSSPKQVGALTNWAKASALGSHILAIKTDGTLWAWGKNGSGQLGIGNVTYYSSPKQVGALTNWSALPSLNSFGNFSVAIKTDGTLWSWGSNWAGQLGLGNTTYKSSPTQVGALTNWSSVSIGRAIVSSIKSDGTIWMWGSNYYGSLGIGTSGNYYSSPKQVGALTDWLKSSSDLYSTLAIKTDGTLWSWGYNNFGQLGLGNTTNRSSPTQVGALTNWLNVSCSYNNLATKTDGTLWAWGRGNNGELGLGNTTYYSSPKQVGSLTTWSLISAGLGFSLAVATA